MRNMPVELDVATWVLSSGQVEFMKMLNWEKKDGKMIFTLKPWNPGMYVLLSSLYASSRRWHEVGEMRLKMRGIGVRKVPRYSWVEVQNKIHTFSVGDTTHPQSHQIYGFLEELRFMDEPRGLLPCYKFVLHDVEEEEKAHIIKYHSEKSAAAFAILNVLVGRPIRVIINLHVCEDCPNTFEYISKIFAQGRDTGYHKEKSSNFSSEQSHLLLRLAVKISAIQQVVDFMGCNAMEEYINNVRKTSIGNTISGNKDQGQLQREICRKERKNIVQVIHIENTSFREQTVEFHQCLEKNMVNIQDK
ncbi:hypothetical protein M9H77_27129 [Catharanthus roseus]|uniref:Uncharacterized protein n=1 Tax=Catharanthus roseus TaxID=4058 RepID=A0ACC0AFS0_CATRO|nr:hypothetical protein M9H77_27129 [Catharanthus roseus]